MPNLAESIFRELLTAKEDKLGADHPDVALTIMALGADLLERAGIQLKPSRSYERVCDLGRQGTRRLVTLRRAEPSWRAACSHRRITAEAEPLLLIGLSGTEDP